MLNIIDHLVFRAKLEPGAIAIQRTDYQMTFAQLLVIVKRIVSKLRKHGVRPGDIVVTNIPDKMLDWVITLALMHESVVTCSNYLTRPIIPSISYDWLLTDTMIDGCRKERTLLIDGEWFNSIQDEPFDSPYVRQAKRLSRIVLTSGTTGMSKAVSLDFPTILERAKNSLEYILATRFLSLFPLASGLGLNNAVIRLIKGLPLYCAGSGPDTVALINRFSIEAMHGSVAQLAGLLKDAKRINQIPASLQAVIYAGGAASPAFLEGVRQELTPNIYNDFGSTETAGLCTFKPGSQTSPAICGIPYPDVSVQVVNESHEPLALEEEGLLRFQRPHMVNGYYHDPNQTAASFRDGWFYSGDRGRLMKEGVLVLTGRDSELINRGGIKIDPAAIDRYLVDYPGVEDAAAFGYCSTMGVQDFAIALVIADDFDLEALKRGLEQQFGRSRSPSYYIRVDKVPRNQTGKVLRGQLSTQFRTVLERQETATASNGRP